MDMRTAHILNEATRRFYRHEAASFSATRQGGWPGWEPLATLFAERFAAHPLTALEAWRAKGGCWHDLDGARDQVAATEGVALLDVGCGNLRFERFLGKRTSLAWDFSCVDGTPELLSHGKGLLKDAPHVRGACLVQDVVASLVGSVEVDVLGADSLFDACVAFGFFHHVPGEQNRVHLLRQMLACVRPGGLVAVSLWRFMESERIAARARKATAVGTGELGVDPAQLEAGDHLLGWQDVSGVYRYCHHFDDAEVDRLVAGVQDLAAPEVLRYAADGATGNLNHYLVFERVCEPFGCK